MDSDKLLQRIERMGAAIGPYAKARSKRVYLENFLRSKKCLLMQQSDEKTISGKEMFAYAHDEYIALLVGLREAVEVEERCRWALERLKMEVEIWRTLSANERFQRDKI